MQAREYSETTALLSNEHDIGAIKPSAWGLKVVNVTYQQTVYAATYFKKFNTKEKVFFRYSKPVRIDPAHSKLIPKPSCTCTHSYGARVFFSTSLSVLQEKIPKHFSERIGSHSVSVTHKVIISIENELLEGYTPGAWRQATRKPVKLPTETIRVRSAYDPPQFQGNNWQVDISDEEESFSDNEENDYSSDDGLRIRRMNGTKNSNSVQMTSLREEQQLILKDIQRTSSIPFIGEHQKVYCPPKRCPLSIEEKRVQQKRSLKCKAGLLKYIPRLEKLISSSDKETFPSVALCMSGGSYRSLVASFGAFQSMRDTGLLDCITYISCLSGTVWSVGMWYSYPEQDLDKVIETLPELLGRTAHSYLNSHEIWEEYKNLQHQKKAADLPRTRFSDLYAVCITKQLLGFLPLSERYNYSISKLGELEKVKSGDLPIPLFSTVFQEPHNYEWLEISPFEVGCDYLSAFVPTRGFGSSFVAGELSYRHPEVTLGQLFGLSSAVFCLTTHRLWKEILLAYELHPLPTEVEENVNFDPATPRRNTITTPRRSHPHDLQHEISIANLQNTTPGDLALSFIQRLDQSAPHDEPLVIRDDEEEDTDQSSRSRKAKMARKLERKFREMKLAKKYLVKPATIPNFAYGLANPMKREKFLQLIDAGMDFCIPFPPLMREERNVKVIIIPDMSAPPDCVEGNSLQASIKWARDHGYHVPDAHYDCVSDDGNIFVFMADNAKAPTIIYIPLRHNPAYGEFDPVENYAEGGYCSTSSLSMTPEQIEELSGLFRCTFNHADDIIKRAIYDTFSLKNNSCSL